MEKHGNWQSTTPGSPNKYLYNGKELHDWAGLNWEDYGEQGTKDMMISFGRSETERSASLTCTRWSLKSLVIFDKELQW